MTEPTEWTILKLTIRRNGRETLWTKTGVAWKSAILSRTLALFFEEMGFPRMAGRILGWLLICDPPEQSAGQLAGVLQASKGSLSTMTRLLIQMGLVERVGLPGSAAIISASSPAHGPSCSGSKRR